jgi:bifunctional DNA-binding transcriptional regulator/antitoxin component of YhaV-PrlF toxin-antitoxin module
LRIRHARTLRCLSVLIEFTESCLNGLLRNAIITGDSLLIEGYLFLRLFKRSNNVPQLVKGGKWTFGWSAVSCNGTIVIPPEAFREYNFREGDEVVLMSGSRTSGGFALTTRSRLSRSKLSALVNGLSEAGKIHSRNRLFHQTTINKGGTLNLPSPFLDGYGIKAGDRLLVVRGSGLAPGFIVRGPIVEEALNHPELEMFS